MKKKPMWILLGLVGILLLTTIYCNLAITRKSAAYIFSDPTQVPHQYVGVVLGTSALLKGGYENPYFLYRVEAAANLYKSGKVEYLLVSGDNSEANYNEPEDMKNALVRLGVPVERIYMDYAGFRTLDSVVRAKEIFGQQSYVIISQPFHNQRAVFLAREKGIDAVAFNAQDVKGSNGYKTHMREWLARVKVFVDLYLNKQPRFGGKKEVIG